MRFMLLRVSSANAASKADWMSWPWFTLLTTWVLTAFSYRMTWPMCGHDWGLSLGPSECMPQIIGPFNHLTYPVKRSIEHVCSFGLWLNFCLHIM